MIGNWKLAFALPANAGSSRASVSRLQSCGRLSAGPRQQRGTTGSGSSTPFGCVGTALQSPLPGLEHRKCGPNSPWDLKPVIPCLWPQSPQSRGLWTVDCGLLSCPLQSQPGIWGSGQGARPTCSQLTNKQQASESCQWMKLSFGFKKKTEL